MSTTPSNASNGVDTAQPTPMCLLIVVWLAAAPGVCGRVPRALMLLTLFQGARGTPTVIGALMTMTLWKTTVNVHAAAKPYYLTVRTAHRRQIPELTALRSWQIQMVVVPEMSILAGSKKIVLQHAAINSALPFCPVLSNSLRLMAVFLGQAPKIQIYEITLLTASPRGKG